MAYKPEQTPNDIAVIGEGVHKVYDEVLTPAGMGDVAIYTELGRFMLAPYGCLVTKAIHEKHIYKEYIELMHVHLTLCVRQSMVHIIILLLRVKRMHLATTSMMSQVLYVRTVISSQLTECFLRLIWAIILLSMIQEHMVFLWDTSIMES